MTVKIYLFKMMLVFLISQLHFTKICLADVIVNCHVLCIIFINLEIGEDLKLISQKIVM